MSRRPRRSGLFLGYWFDVATGRKIRRVKQPELAEAYRLMREHRDIEQGRPRSTGVDPGLAFGERMPLG